MHGMSNASVARETTHICMVVMLGPGRPSIAALMAPTLDPGDRFWGIISAVSGMIVHGIQEAIQS